MGKFYVYLIFRPNWIPCYIGKGHGRRWLMHFRKCYNPHLAAIIAKAGGWLPIIKLDENLTGRKAEKLEKRYIKIIGREMRGGPLVNQTDGGDGVVGRSPESCAKISVANKGRKISEAHRAALVAYSTGRIYSAETREKLAAIQRGRRHSPEAKAKMSAAKKGRPSNMSGRHHTKESNEKNRQAHLGKPSLKKGKPISAAQKEKISIAMRGRPWSDRRRLAYELNLK